MSIRSRFRRGLAGAGFALAVAAAGAPSRADEDVVVDLELVLAVDVSGSIDSSEFHLQRQGYAAAFRDRRLLDAIRSGAMQRIAVALVDWAGQDSQFVSIGWTQIHDAETAARFANAVLAAPRPFARWTSVSGAIDFSTPLFDSNNFVGARRVIDVSGDGINNSGRPATQARDVALARGITINGLIMLSAPSESIAPWPSLEDYFLKNVIGGPGAFLVTASDIGDFQRAVLHKLIREVAAPAAPPADEIRLAATPPTD